MKTFQTELGFTVDQTIAAALKYCSLRPGQVQVVHNDITFYVNHFDTQETAKATWQGLLREKQAAWRNSPEGQAYYAEIERQKREVPGEFHQLTLKTMGALRQVVTNEQLLALAEWTDASDSIYTDKKDAYMMSKHLRSLGFLPIKEIPQFIRDKAESNRDAAIDCIVGNIIDMCEGMGAVHQVAGMLLRKLAKE